MALLEQIVRPFQSPTTVNDRARPVTIVTQAVAEIPILSWGSAGAQPTPFGIDIKTKNNDNKYTELSRVVTPVKIENPDDPSQFVTAQRTDAVKFEKKSLFAIPSQEGPDSNASGYNGGAPTQTAPSSKNSETPTPTGTGDLPKPVDNTGATSSLAPARPEQDQFVLFKGVQGETPLGAAFEIDNSAGAA